MCTYWSLQEHAALVSHYTYNVQWVDGLQYLQLAQSCLHENKHTRSTNTSTKREAFHHNTIQVQTLTLAWFTL